MARTSDRRAPANECRDCPTFCDRVIAPASCLEAGCDQLYAYDDHLSGRRYLGCVQQVFAAEIDEQLFRDAERGRGGYGAVKVTGTPLRRCAFTVEQAYVPEQRTACRNRRFFDFPEGPDAIRAFDLRAGLESS